MPLNIDWQQILLHIFNFVILAGGLYLLLFKPVKKFMDDRTEYYENMDSQAKEKLADAEKAKAEYTERLSNVDAEISEKRLNAAKEAEAQSQAQINEAKQEAEKIIEASKVKAEKERERIVKSAQSDITKLAVAATEKLLKDNGEDAFDHFISVATKEDNDDE